MNFSVLLVNFVKVVRFCSSSLNLLKNEKFILERELNFSVLLVNFVKSCSFLLFIFEFRWIRALNMRKNLAFLISVEFIGFACELCVSCSFLLRFFEFRWIHAWHVRKFLAFLMRVEVLRFCLWTLWKFFVFWLVWIDEICFGFVEMVEVTKLMYIVVVDDEDKKEERKVSFRYTRPVLQSTLQLMGCKARHAFKVCFFFLGTILQFNFTEFCF